MGQKGPNPDFFKIKVHPNSREDRILRKTIDSFEAWVKAPAERGLANIAMISMLARETGINPRRLQIIKGSRSPSKIIKFY